MSLDEFELIDRYFSQPFNHSLDLSGGGDDCAVLDLPAGMQQVLSNDTSIESVHFKANMPPRQIAYRALAVALSDLAAMGATPWWFSLGLSLPKVDEAWLKDFSLGMQQLAERVGIQLIGGDTTRGDLSIAVQVAGLVPQGRYLSRKTAQIGDLIAVTGTLGDAAAGLAQWGQADAAYYLRQRYCEPTPRTSDGSWLLAYASACIDVSDGLIADIGHIARQSQQQCVIHADKIPLSQALTDHFSAEQALTFALNGGDDYELCFTLKPEFEAILRAQALAFTVIGSVQAGDGVTVLDKNKQPINVPHQGFKHFL